MRRYRKRAKRGRSSSADAISYFILPIIFLPFFAFFLAYPWIVARLSAGEQETLFGKHWIVYAQEVFDGLTPSYLIFLVFIGLLALWGLLDFFKDRKQRKRIRELHNAALNVADSSSSVTAKEFMEFREAYYINGKDYEGCYLILNASKKDKPYVGQSKTVVARARRHFTPFGNGDIYFDYKSGDELNIRIIPLKGSGFKTLNELEKNLIDVYRAKSKGYNRKNGNKT